MSNLPGASVQHLVTTLDRLGLEFSIVGGVAVALISTPRFTADIDAVLLNIDDRLEWLVAELAQAGYSGRTSDPVAFARRTRVLTLVDPYEVGIDLMLGLLPFDEDLVRKSNRVRIEGDLDVPVACAEHLVVMKAVAWRPKDVEDIRQIVLANPSLDKRYVMSTFSEYAELLEEPERIGELARLLGPQDGSDGLDR
ncbi:MAG TPA: nucleotidyltransferase [Fimbriimonadaceae bacterium]|nr:nucleotidyltransferase [Fimbriimonadaceae bacterium]